MNKEEIGQFLDFSRKSVDTYLNNNKLYKNRFKIISINDDKYLYRYELPIDQLKYVIDTLKKDPNNRRLFISAWEPTNFRESALMPCHVSFSLVHIDGVLNLCWTQRSADAALGVPFNIASYALLLELICKEVNMVPGELVGTFSDCHIYENHIDGVKEQLTRTPKNLPRIKLLDKPFFDWTHKDIILEGYDPHPKIDFGGVAI